MGLKSQLKQLFHIDETPEPMARDVATRLRPETATCLGSFAGSPPSVCDAILQLLEQDTRDELENLNIVARQRRFLGFTPLGYKVIEFLDS